jgi:chloramphenicol 3-O phosphotransferase
MGIIFLNGCTSAGKTSLARAMQARLDPPHLRYGIDDAFAMLPVRLHNHPDGFFFDVNTRGQVRLNHGPFGRAMLNAYRRAAVTIAATGIGLIVDEVVLDPVTADDWIDLARTIDVFAVAVHCSIGELERREVARGDRLIGQARGQIDLVHRWFDYALEVDTSAHDTDAVASTIVNALDGAPPTRLTMRKGR